MNGKRNNIECCYGKFKMMNPCAAGHSYEGGFIMLPVSNGRYKMSSLQTSPVIIRMLWNACTPNSWYIGIQAIRFTF